MDRERLQLFGESLKRFLKSKLSREMSVFAFFFVVSAGFWLLQTLHEDYEMDLNYSLVLENIPDGIVITEELPELISVKVKDKGSTLMRDYQWRSTPTLSVKFSAYDRGAAFGHVILTHSEILKLVSPSLQPSSRIVSVHPDTLDFYYTRGVQRRMPLLFSGHVEASSVNYVEKLSLSPDSVTIWGPESLLDSLTSVTTVMTNISGLSENLEQKIQIATIRGTKIVPAEATLTAEVDVYTEKHVRVPVQGTNFPAGYSLRTFPSFVDVSFSVGSKKYREIKAENFVLTATYEELLALPDSMLTLQLRSVPEGVTQIRITPERVQYLIEQADIE